MAPVRVHFLEQQAERSFAELRTLRGSLSPLSMDERKRMIPRAIARAELAHARLMGEPSLAALRQSLAEAIKKTEALLARAE